MTCERTKIHWCSMHGMLAFVAVVLVGLSSPAQEHYLTSTFGNSERCEHRGTLICEGDRIRFDLTALSFTTVVHRAILRVSAEGHRTGERVDVLPLGLSDSHALKLRGPHFDSFDASAAVKRWVSNPSSNQGCRIHRSGGVDFRTAVLEVSYAGKTNSLNV